MEPAGRLRGWLDRGDARKRGQAFRQAVNHRGQIQKSHLGIWPVEGQLSNLELMLERGRKDRNGLDLDIVVAHGFPVAAEKY